VFNSINCINSTSGCNHSKKKEYSLLFSICLYCAEKMLENTLFNDKYTAFQLDIKQIREVEVNDLHVMYLKLKLNHLQYKVRVLHNEWLTSQQ
jgi:hypothetical protein